jgi:hypothetical protein
VEWELRKRSGELEEGGKSERGKEIASKQDIPIQRTSRHFSLIAALNAGLRVQWGQKPFSALESRLKLKQQKSSVSELLRM